MSKLSAHYLAFYNNKNWPNSVTKYQNVKKRSFVSGQNTYFLEKKLQKYSCFLSVEVFIIQYTLKKTIFLPKCCPQLYYVSCHTNFELCHRISSGAIIGNTLLLYPVN